MFKIKLLFILLSSFLFAQTIVIDQSSNNLEILPLSQIYIDNTKTLSLEDIKNKEFEKNDKTTLSYGYAPAFSVWVKFTLKNNSNKHLKKTLQFDHEITSFIQFFDGKEVINEGINNLQKARSSVKPIFEINLEPKETKTYYISTKSYITPLTIKLNLWIPKNFFEKEINHQFALALFFGAMLVLAFYNLFIFFSTKDKSYLFYVFYILGAIYHHIFYSGIIFRFTITPIIEFLITRGAYITVMSQFIALLIFSKYFLELKKFPKLNRILNFYLIVILLFICIGIYNEYTSGLQIIFYLSSLIFLFFTAVYLSIKKVRQAYFLLAGWLALFTTWILMYLINIGIFTHESYSYYLVEIGILAEALIFSFALADKIKVLQRDKQKANEKLITQQQNEKQKLKKEVDIKTKDLQLALGEKELLFKELHHRVKNNMQMIVSMIRLQSKGIEDKKFQEVFQTAQNRINTMAHLHELLYKQDNITHINTLEYFTMLIDELQETSNKEILINYNIKANLKMEQAIYCGLILNELISNSIKYAFKEKGEINIFLIKEKNTYTLKVQDNGIGFDTSKRRDSLGLILINTLSTRQLKGEISFDTKNGTKVDIRWQTNE